ncbi:MAG: ribosome maturation factor [Chitinophagaceae bacterium]|nr:ribosome maturation factor [Chitinophagaceae bacterium]
MSSEAISGAIAQMTTSLLEEDPDYFLVEVRINPTNNVKVFLDADGGVSIDKCVKYNRALYKQIEDSGIFTDGNFSLEVSSPGLDEPLKLRRQYVKNTGRKVEVVLADGSRIEGKLNAANEEEIVIEEVKGKNKKQEIIEHRIPIGNIKSTKIQIQF